MGLQKIFRFVIPAFDANNASTRVQVAAGREGRQVLRLINRGTALAEYGFESTIAPGGGDTTGNGTWPLAPGSALNGQGGGDDVIYAHPGPVYVVSAVGTVVTLMEG